VTGGNVSLYNETKGEGIYPTPVIGVVGILEDVSKAVPSGFQRAGEVVIHLYPTPLWARTRSAPPSDDEYKAMRYREIGSSEFARQSSGLFWGTPPELNIEWEADLHELLILLASEGLISSASDISDGGLFGIGFDGDIYEEADTGQPISFAEDASNVIVTCCKANQPRVRELAASLGLESMEVGTTRGNRLSISVEGTLCVDLSIAEIRAAYASTLESQLDAEVVTA
jgi:phosphoribosylformylglycinamidine synthase